MTIRFRAASAASMALVCGAQHGGGGLRQVFLGHAERGQVLQGRQRRCTPGRTGRRRPRSTRRSSPTRTPSTTIPQLATAYFFLGNSYDQLYKPAKQGDADQRRLHPEGDRELPQGGGQEHRPGLEEVGPPVPVGRLRLRQAERPGQGRARLPGNHRPGARASPATTWRSPSSTRTRAATTTPRRSTTRRKRSSPTTRRCWPASPATTTGRGTSRRRSRRSNRPPALEPNNPEGYHRVAVFYWDKTRGDFRLSAAREARLHPEGPGDGRQGPQPQPRLHGGDDLQEHPPPSQGQHHDGCRRSRSASSTRPTSSASGSSTRRTASRRARGKSARSPVDRLH